MMKHYSKTSANQLSSKQQVGIQIVKPISYVIPLQKSVPLRNPPIALENDEPDQQEDEQNYYSAMSKAFGFAGLMGILKGDSVGDEKKDLGEEQIVHMIKLARLSQEVGPILFCNGLFKTIFYFIYIDYYIFYNLTEERVQEV
jgi:hypothetical protein